MEVQCWAAPLLLAVLAGPEEERGSGCHGMNPRAARGVTALKAEGGCGGWMLSLKDFLPKSKQPKLDSYNRFKDQTESSQREDLFN